MFRAPDLTDITDFFLASLVVGAFIFGLTWVSKTTAEAKPPQRFHMKDFSELSGGRRAWVLVDSKKTGCFLLVETTNSNAIVVTSQPIAC